MPRHYKRNCDKCSKFYQGFGRHFCRDCYNAKITKIKDLTELQKGYLAGMIDGEGCVRIARVHRNPDQYQALVLITNTNLPVLHYLKEIAGAGTIYEAKYGTRGKPNWRPVHRWQITSRQARELLEAVLPHLIIKREVAELVLSMPIDRFAGLSLKASNKNMQAKLFEVIKVKNRRGIFKK